MVLNIAHGGNRNHERQFLEGQARGLVVCQGVANADGGCKNMSMDGKVWGILTWRQWFKKMDCLAGWGTA